MSTSSEQNATDAGATGPADSEGSLDWVGRWRVRRYDGEVPSVPTYYDATPGSWDVITAGEEVHVAPHPILDIREEVIILKDEGAADEAAERWAVQVEHGELRVTAETGPHEGVVGIAERIEGTAPDRVFSNS